jgi:hypothetical protein
VCVALHRVLLGNCVPIALFSFSVLDKEFEKKNQLLHYAAIREGVEVSKQ